MKIIRVSLDFNKSVKESKLESRMQNCDIYGVNLGVTSPSELLHIFHQLPELLK